jgi:DNA-binding MarR family transcriptional regulator
VGTHVQTEPPLGAKDAMDVALLDLLRVALAASVHAAATHSPALTPTQVRVLTVVSGARDGITLTDLAEVVSLSAPSTSRLCQRLARDGWLDRAAGPGHYVLVSLTKKGRAGLAAVNRKRLAPLRQVVDELPPRRRAALQREIEELAQRAASHAGIW